MTVNRLGVKARLRTRLDQIEQAFWAAVDNEFFDNQEEM